MSTAVNEIEIKPRRKTIITNIVSISLSVCFFLVILNIKMSGIWLWLWNILLSAFLFIFIYFFLNLPIITIGRKGIGCGSKELYEWKDIKHAFLIHYNNKYHSVHLNIVYDDENGKQKETNLDVTDYEHYMHDVDGIIEYWMNNQPKVESRCDFDKEKRYLSLLDLVRDENKKENKKTYIFTLLLCLIWLFLTNPIEESMGSRGYITLVVILSLFLSGSIAMFIYSLIMSNVQDSFMSKHPMSLLSKDERDELMGMAKIHKCELTNWKKYTKVSLFATPILGLAVFSCYYFA